MKRRERSKEREKSEKGGVKEIKKGEEVKTRE